MNLNKENPIITLVDVDFKDTMLILALFLKYIVVKVGYFIFTSLTKLYNQKLMPKFICFTGHDDELLTEPLPLSGLTLPYSTQIPAMTLT